MSIKKVNGIAVASLKKIVGIGAAFIKTMNGIVYNYILNTASFSLDGVNDTLYDSNTAHYDYTTTFDFTVALSLKISSVPVGGRFIVCKRIELTNVGWSLAINGNNLSLQLITNASNKYQYIYTGVIANTTTTYRIMVRFSNVKANFGLYLNGVLQTPSTDASIGTLGTITNTAKFCIGSLNNFAGYYFPGLIDEVRFWNSNETGQVLADYNGGVAGDPSLLSPVPEHMYRAENVATDSGSVGGYNLTASGGATYGAGIP